MRPLGVGAGGKRRRLGARRQGSGSLAPEVQEAGIRVTGAARAPGAELEGLLLGLAGRGLEESELRVAGPRSLRGLGSVGTAGDVASQAHAATGCAGRRVPRTLAPIRVASVAERGPESRVPVALGLPPLALILLVVLLLPRTQDRL